MLMSIDGFNVLLVDSRPLNDIHFYNNNNNNDNGIYLLGRAKRIDGPLYNNKRYIYNRLM